MSWLQSELARLFPPTCGSSNNISPFEIAHNTNMYVNSNANEQSKFYASTPYMNIFTVDNYASEQGYAGQSSKAIAGKQDNVFSSPPPALDIPSFACDFCKLSLHPTLLDIPQESTSIPKLKCFVDTPLPELPGPSTGFKKRYIVKEHPVDTGACMPGSTEPSATASAVVDSRNETLAVAVPSSSWADSAILDQNMNGYWSASAGDDTPDLLTPSSSPKKSSDACTPPKEIDNFTSTSTSSLCPSASGTPRRGRSSRSSSPRSICCVFCKKNGESKAMYQSHQLKHPTSGIIICPVLRQYACSECGATGDIAHTRSYCPSLQTKLGKKVPSATLALKSTLRQGNGNLRRRL